MRSTPWTGPQIALSGGSWPACLRAPRTSPCELGPRGREGLRGRLGLNGGPCPFRVIPHLFPKYIRAPNGPEANPVKQLQPSECVGVGGRWPLAQGEGGGLTNSGSAPDEEADYLGVRIQLRRERVGSGAAGFLEWWVIELQDCQAECNLLPMVIFSDKVSPPSLGFLAGYG